MIALSPHARRRLALVGLIVCLVALVAELVVQMTGHLARGGTLPGAVLRFLSYYTVVTNILLTLIYAAYLKQTPAMRGSSRWPLR